MISAKTLRCAIYTRKSSEEGLEQHFNSLHAQREACEAYVLSQAGEGWTALPAIYDDGGFSGGSLERPALAQLLTDIERGQIDVVVVYKVDRLTRSLSDFARIVEIFDKRGVSFVSVTQAFNTTSSMGRLTLNVLLSFAQFEREVTGERIRDKIAASKAKGMWMGGGVPLGYDIPTDQQTRALVVIPSEAETVQMIFRRYLELGSVRELAADLCARGVATKARATNATRKVNERPWLEGPLYYILRNRTYRGEIVHKGVLYPGRHPAIIDAELFDAVQARLQAKAPKRTSTTGPLDPSPLAGRIFDDRGHPMSPVTVRKGGRHYRYYVSQAVIRTDRGAAGSVARVPARTLEALIENRIVSRLAEGSVDAPLDAVERAVISVTGIDLKLNPAALAAPHREAGAVVFIEAALRSGGGAKQLIDGAGKPAEPHQPDLALQAAIARARRWEMQLARGERKGADDIAAAEGLQSRYVDKLLKLAWLEPSIVERILDGWRPNGLSFSALIELDLPMAWAEQDRYVQLH